MLCCVALRCVALLCCVCVGWGEEGIRECACEEASPVFLDLYNSLNCATIVPLMCHNFKKIFFFRFEIIEQTRVHTLCTNLLLSHTSGNIAWRSREIRD